jgi:hypothetical protein
MTKHEPISLDWYSDTERMIEAAKRDGDLTECAARLDSYEFLELPEHQQLYLCTLYSEAYFRLTGAMI